MPRKVICGQNPPERARPRAQEFKAKEKDAQQAAGLALLIEGCKILGWSIGIPYTRSKTDDSVRGLVVGEPKWMDKTHRFKLETYVPPAVKKTKSRKANG